MDLEYKPFPSDNLEYRGGKEIGHVKPDRDWSEQDNANNSSQGSTDN